MYDFDIMNCWNIKFINKKGAFPFVIVQGVAMGSLEICTHVILMPESGLYGYVQLYCYYLFHILFGHAQTLILFLVLVIPPHPPHKVSHDHNRNA